MQKFVKISLSIVISLSLIILIGSFILAFFIKPDYYRPQITQYLANKTGRPVTIGHINWAFFPIAHFEIKGLTIGNPPSDNAQPFMQVANTEIRVNLPLLLQKKLLIENISLENATVNLMRTTTGQANWNFKPAPTIHTTNTLNKPTHTQFPKITFLGFDKIRIANAIILWQDAAHNQNFSIKIKTLTTQDFNLKGNPCDINAEFTYQAQKNLINASMQGQLIMTDHTVAVNNLVLTMDQTHIKGQINFKSLSPLEGNAAFNIDQLNLDTYSGIKNSSAENFSVTKESSDNTQVANPVSSPAVPQATFKADINIANLIIHNLVLTQVSLPLMYGQEILQIAPITAQAAKGNMQAKFIANYTASTPLYTLEGSFNNIDVNVLLSQLANDHRFSGAGQITWSLSSMCNNKITCIEGLNGLATIVIKNGSYTGINILQTLNNAAAIFLKSSSSKTFNSNITDFDLLQATYNIQNGIAQNEDLMLSSPVLTLTGNGKINFITQEIKYHLAVTPLLTISLQITQLQQLIGKAIPLKLQGTLAKPVLIPNMKAISQNMTKQNFNKDLNNLNDTLNEDSKKIAKSLKDIFNN